MRRPRSERRRFERDRIAKRCAPAPVDSRGIVCGCAVQVDHGAGNTLTIATGNTVPQFPAVGTEPVRPAQVRLP
jgi:hypothetical protein